MRRFFRSFRQLKWKLTASYTLVTVSTLIVLEVIVLVAGLFAARGLLAELPPAITEQMRDELAPQVSPYLSSSSTDLIGIHAWLESAEPTGLESSVEPLRGAPGVTINLNAMDILGSEADYLVVDRRGRLVGDANRPSPLSEPEPFNASSSSDLEEVLPYALAGSSDPDELSTITPGGAMSIAVPIRDSEGQVVGALVFSTPFSPLGAVIGGLGIFVLSSLVIFTVLVGSLGTFFGFLTARGLTRRLNRVTAAATAWGAGDFSPTLRDRSADEIGQLARRLNQMAAQLEELIEARQQLSALDERNRLARDLHDSVKQQAFAISMNLGAAQALLDRDPAAARARLDTAFELSRRSQQELTTIIQTLRPVELEGSTLSEALASAVERWQKQTGIEGSFEDQGNGRLPVALEEALYRVAQEALSNTARHSGASRARVGLAVTKEQVTLMVQDNGRGFDAELAAQGVGLRSMRERLAALGGSLRIQSDPQGTSVIAQAPIEKEGRR